MTDSARDQREGATTGSKEPASDLVHQAGRWCPSGRHTRSGRRSNRACAPCATGATETAAALVAAGLVDLTPERAAELVGQVAYTGGRLESLIGHLRAHPDALGSGSSDCPRVVIDLIDHLVATGVAGAAYAHCVRCEQPRRQLQTLVEGGRVCESCRHRAKTETCSLCGRDAPVRSRTETGPWCARCDANDPSRWERCSQCGTPGQVITRTAGRPIGRCCYSMPVIRCTVCGIAKGVRPWKTRRPVCSDCALLDRVVCSRCGKDAPPPTPGQDPVCALCLTIVARPCHGCGHLTPGRDRAGQPRCPDCYQRPVRSCGQCGRIRAIARLAVGDDPELCAICWTGPTVACAACGQLRPCRGERRGRMLCASCAPCAPQPCAHCGRQRRVTAHWHEGPVCPACYRRALAAKDNCPECGHTRRLMTYPGWTRPVCSTCADAPDLAVCTRCGVEDALYRRGLCPSCSLPEVLDEVIGDPTARSHNGLQPVADRLLALGRPRLVLHWLQRERSSAAILGRFASGELELTHETFTQLPATRSTWFIERLLVTSGALPARDPVLARMERWTNAYLDAIADPECRALLRRFAQWHLLRPLRLRSRNGPLSDHIHNSRKELLKTAVGFLAWLDEQGRELSDCTQHVLDRWAVTGPAGWENVQPFLRWARRQGLVGDLDFPVRSSAPAVALLGEDERWGVVRRLLHDPEIDDVVRVAGLLVVLYAQPVTRICRIRHADITCHVDPNGDEQLEIALGASPIRLPSLVSQHVQRLITAEPAATVSTMTGDERWLFPGRMPGRPLHSSALSTRLRANGIRTSVHRQSALAHLAAKVPAAITADLLGIAVKTAVNWASQTGRTWSDYTHHRN